MSKSECKTCGYYDQDTGECEYWGAPVELVEDCDKKPTKKEVKP
jgi:hypothetical protein